MPLAFAPFFLWPLAILIPALLLCLIQYQQSLLKQFLSGWIFGIGYFGFGLYWIYNSLHDFGQAPPIVASAITGLLVLVLALAPALTLLFWRYSQRHLTNTGFWLLPFFWFGLEWIKGWIFTGMPWLSLGYSQTNSPLAGYAPLVGVYGISAICILMASALFVLQRDKRFSMLVILIVLPLAGWLLQPLEWTQAQAGTLKVTMVQGNIPQQIKWRRDQHQNIFNTYWRETSQHWDSDLIIWPETALPGNSEEIEQALLQPMQTAAVEQDTTIIAGLVVSEGEQNRFFNSAIMLGKKRGLYHKRHLVVFGEYYPMRWLLDLFRGLINIPYSDLTSGPTEQTLMQIDNITLGMSICFEDVFSREILLALPAANLLVNLSNDAWFGDSTAPHQHMQIAQMRSQETGRMLMRATNTGVSAFIDHKGKVLARSEQFKTQSISEVVQGRTGVTPFYYFARVQGLLAILPFVAVLLLARRKAG